MTPIEVREWLEANLPRAWFDAGRAGGPAAVRAVRTPAEYVAWYPVFAASGLVVPTWPVEYGGLGVTPDTARAIEVELGGEAIGWTAADWKEFGVGKLGAVGRPHAAFDVRVRADDGAVAPRGIVGELEIRPTAARPQADAALAGRITDDGWLRTGDLARVDGDGFVWIEGRVSAMINRGGLKVFPDEVEERIRALPGVADVAVAGVPDGRLGEVPWAFVVPDGTGSLTLARLQDWCRAALAAYKIPAGLTEVGVLPRNEIGKVLPQDLIPLARAD
ncbi:MAG: AMP-binding enzyme [Actinomycetota bacterium]